MPTDTDGILYPGSGLGDPLPATSSLEEIKGWAEQHPLAVGTLYVGLGMAVPVFPGTHRAAPSDRVFLRLAGDDPFDLWASDVSVAWDAWDGIAVALKADTLSLSRPLIKKAVQALDVGYLVSEAAAVLDSVVLSGGNSEPYGGVDPGGAARTAGWSASWDGGFNRE